jgi:hypothetical protein
VASKVERRRQGRIGPGVDDRKHGHPVARPAPQLQACSGCTIPA